jgi:squalene synthase HpnC
VLLDWWAAQLRRCYLGEADHPVFVALAETIRQFDLPIEPLADLLVAFRRDQRVTRYGTFDELLNYCHYSANPVGRIVLYLGRCHSPERAELSDRVCTGLQLANFCQDVARDYRRGRIYLPAEDCRRWGYTEDDFAAGRCNDAFRDLLREQVDRAEGYLHQGAALVPMMPRGLRLQIALFTGGGLAVLGAIRRQGYDVWTRRPALSTMAKLRVFARSWWQLRRRRLPLLTL